MIFHIDDETIVDTDTDLRSEEKHILQKLLCYKIFVTSMEEFREKTRQAFRVGWNNSGPVPESPTMAMVIKLLEQEVHTRLTQTAGEN